MYSAQTKFFRILISIPLVFCFSAVSAGQDSKGSADLDKAFDLKIKAQSTTDLDAVVKLCKSAIEKGLDDEGKIQAQQLAASALYEHADQLNQRIFGDRGMDPRWQKYRTQALTRLNKAVEYQPELTAAYLMIARMSILPNGDRDAAKAALEKAVKYAGEDREQLSNALFLRAALSEDTEEQLSDINQAIKINPKNSEAIRVRALRYLGTDQTDKAIEDLDLWLESDSVTTQQYLETVGLLMRLGPKFDEKLQTQAIKILDKAIEHDPENPNPHADRARINVIREKLDDAIADATQAIQLDRRQPAHRRDINNLTMRASIYLEQDQLDKALADVQAVLEIEPMSIQGIRLRGLILMQQENFSEAIDDIKLLAANYPGDQLLQRQLAMLYNADNQPGKAIEIYDTLIELNAEEKFASGSDDEQLAAMAERTAALRGRGDARLSTGEHALAAADYEEAYKSSEELRQLQEQETDKPVPADDGILNNLAWVLATSTFDEVRDGKRAIELATLAAEATEYKEAHILSTLASGYAEVGDFDNAIKWIEKAIEVNRETGTKNPSKRNVTQSESLQKEYARYQEKKPWRENQKLEAEAAEREKADKEKAESEDKTDAKPEKEAEEPSNG